MTSTITDPLQRPRRVERLVTGEPTRHGASVTLTHVINGPALQRRLDPFLVLDAFDSDEGPTTSPASRIIRTAASRRSRT